MSVKIISKTLKNEYFEFNAMAFIASESTNKGIWAIMTHGYTASKSDCISWASRLSDAGINSVIFDLPGHLLGSYNSISSFEIFTDNAHKCFLEALQFANEEFDSKCERLILCGHSLGALLALKAINLPQFDDLNPIAIAIGYGLNKSEGTHIFDTPIYQKTITIRRQLVHKSIDSDLMFPWIKSFKKTIEITNKRIHLICGKDDIVVGDGGMQFLADSLSEKGNTITTSEPNRLPHNNPELAASHIYSFLKKELSL